MDRNLAAAVSRASIINVSGWFQRHASPKIRTVAGSAAGGRWGLPGAYPVIYLGRPSESVVVEAYRHLVDGVEGMRPDLVGPRTVFEVEVVLTQILDLRDLTSLREVGLDQAALLGPHAPCQRVGQAAHQLGLHGVLAPAATEIGETLALFERHLPESELPAVVAISRWGELPADPRTLEQRARQMQEGR
jgi:RES domain